MSSLGGLLFVMLIALFLISRKSQRVMRDLLEIMTRPEQVQIQNASRVLHAILKDEIDKISDNFKSMSDTLKKQIEYADEMGAELSKRNGQLVSAADDATKTVVNMSQRLDNSIDGLNVIIGSSGWTDVQRAADSFNSNVDTLLNKLDKLATDTTQNATKIQEQITNCTEAERNVSEQLQNSFKSNTESMANMTNTARDLKEHLTDLSANVTDGFNNIKASSHDYDDTLKKNDKMLNEYLTKLSEFGKMASKELSRQSVTLTETSNAVSSATRLEEASLDKHIAKLEKAIDSLNSSAEFMQKTLSGASQGLAVVANRFNDELDDIAGGAAKKLQDVSNMAKTTLNTTQTSISTFENSVKDMESNIKTLLTNMNKANIHLSTQSAGIIDLSRTTSEQLKPLSDLIEKYYAALPELANGSKEINANIQQTVDTLVAKIDLMKNTVAESMANISGSSTQLEELSGQSRQQMIDLMSDYAKAVEAMQSLNKQMMVARATAPMEAIKAVPAQKFKPVSTKDFLAQIDTVFDKLYEQSVDLTRALGSDIPAIVWKKYNDGDTKIFAKWLVKKFAVTNSRQIRDLIRTDKVFNSQATQFVRNFDKILTGAEQTNDANKVRTAILKTDLGTIYNTIHKYI